MTFRCFPLAESLRLATFPCSALLLLRRWTFSLLLCARLLLTLLHRRQRRLVLDFQVLNCLLWIKIRLLKLWDIAYHPWCLAESTTFRSQWCQSNTHATCLVMCHCNFLPLTAVLTETFPFLRLFTVIWASLKWVISEKPDWLLLFAVCMLALAQISYHATSLVLFNQLLCCVQSLANPQVAQTVAHMLVIVL